MELTPTQKHIMEQLDKGNGTGVSIWMDDARMSRPGFCTFRLPTDQVEALIASDLVGEAVRGRITQLTAAGRDELIANGGYGG